MSREQLISTELAVGGGYAISQIQPGIICDITLSFGPSTDFGIYPATAAGSLRETTNQMADGKLFAGRRRLFPLMTADIHLQGWCGQLNLEIHLPGSHQCRTMLLASARAGVVLRFLQLQTAAVTQHAR